MPAQPNNNNNTNNFFDQVGTQNLPLPDEKKQPWKEFHEPDEKLVDSGSVTVEIPSSDETGMYIQTT